MGDTGDYSGEEDTVCPQTTSIQCDKHGGEYSLPSKYGHSLSFYAQYPLPFPPLPFLIFHSLYGFFIHSLGLQLHSIYRCIPSPLATFLPNSRLTFSNTWLIYLSVPESPLQVNSFKIKILFTFHSISLK